jgi:hypothetical protein
MEYTRTELSHLPSNEPKQITFIWGNDGWRYVPQLKIRDRFTETLYYRESWDGVIAIPVSIETLTWAVHSKEPVSWSEGVQLFSLKSSSQKENKNNLH